jgi:hypothetical protein
MAIDASNLKTPYSSDKSILPDIGKDDTTNRRNGLLTDTAITNHITTKLQANNILPKDNDVPAKYNEKMDKFIKYAKEEYTYYYERYKYALSILFTKIIDTYRTPPTTTAVPAAVQTALDDVAAVNLKLNDILSVVQTVSTNMHNAAVATNTQVTEMMKTMLENKDKMEKQGNMIRSNQASSNIQKEMVKYTEEKARYNDNLLKVYSFLNIVALGVLLYVYKAAE